MNVIKTQDTPKRLTISSERNKMEGEVFDAKAASALSNSATNVLTPIDLIKQAAKQGRRNILLYLSWEELFKLHELGFHSDLISKSVLVGGGSRGWHSITW